ERDQSVVAYLLESEEAGRAPSVEEIAAAFGFSKGAAWRSLQRLMEAGAVKSNPRRYRSYRAVRDAPIVPFDLSTIP
ncbi:LexA family protein, partial [Campylobacter jejuni]